MCSQNFKIKCENLKDLQRKISSVDCSVPVRTAGRKSEHREMYCLRIYLTCPSVTDLLSFPLTVLKSESPDFFIQKSDGSVIGLEVAEASVEEDQELMTVLEKKPNGTMLESDIIDGKYQGRLVKPGEELFSRGMVGDSVEREWVKIVLNLIYKKTKLLNELYSEIPNRYELLIYDNSPLSGLHTETALSMLNSAIQDDSRFKSFKRIYHRISIIHNGRLINYKEFWGHIA